MNLQIPDFKKARVLVVGDIMLDRYWYGDVSRISPEAPVPVVRVQKLEEKPGGAGNVAINVAALEAQITLLGITGNDAESQTLKNYLSNAGVNCQFRAIDDAPTITKLRVLGQHQQLIRLDFEDGFPASNHLEELLVDFEMLLPQIDAVILSDYGKGTLKNAQAFIDIAKKTNTPVFVDPKSTDFNIYRGATVITPNFKEFEAVVGACHNEKDITTKAKKLLQDYDIEALLITRGEKGMTLICRNDEDEIHLPTQAKEIYDVTGAGDTAIATLTTSFAAGMDLPKAMQLANAAAGIAVSKLGAATTSCLELQSAIQNTPVGGIVNVEQLLLSIKSAHALNEKIVMTNGCFDILHAGHVHYLEQAKKLGNRLIVAVNDDSSVSRLKGKYRPINPIEKRLAVLAGLSAVDWVIPFSEDTPESLISKLLPDVLVKGGDWKPEEVAGGQSVIKNGGQVKILDFVEGCSTTSMIDKVKQANEKEIQ